MAGKHIVRSAMLICIASLGLVNRGICDEPVVMDPARAESLSRKIDEIQAQLGKLDQIVEQLRRLRTEELPRLQRELHQQAEASVLVKSGERTTQKPITEATPHLPGESETNPAAPGALESQLAAVHQKLQQLDDIAAQVMLLREDDLPRLKGELARIASAAPGANDRQQALRPVSPTQGRLVITNLSGLTRDVAVNGTTYRFDPGSWQVRVPYQEVTTRLTSSDQEHLWGTSLWKQTDTGPEMRLEIK